MPLSEETVGGYLSSDCYSHEEGGNIKTTTYNYDNGGNILSKTTYDYATGSLDGLTGTVVQYTYGDSNWKDKLTAYNGNTITYDAIGNPINYYNGTTFEWSGGRQLARATKQDGTYMSYRYDDSGVRIRKSVNGVSTDYFVDGSTIVAEKTGNNLVWYYYDAAGLRVGFTYNNIPYYYIYNAQGDVIGLFNVSQQIVARYNYDAWGKIVSVTDGSGAEITDTTHIAHVNPFRYRGYYYDTDTGLYYVSSRYYDPEIGRFISPDTTDVLTATPMGLTDKNLYAYCDNNLVMRADHGGDFWNVVIGAAVGAVVGVAGQFISDLATSALNGKWTFSNWQTYAGAAVGGAVGGAILGGTGHVGWANAASGFVTTGVGMSLEKVTGASDKSWAEIGVNAVADGAISYRLGKLPGVKNVTKGRNNMSAVYRSGLTKLRNKTVSHMSKKVIGKGLVSSFVGGLAMDGYYGVKQYGYNRVRNRILRYAG